MKRLFVLLSAVAALAVCASPTYAATSGPEPGPAPAGSTLGGIKPDYNWELVPKRTDEWAKYFYGAGQESPGRGEVQWPYECRGPVGHGNHNETQWWCYGHITESYAEPKRTWQVNIDAYGAQTYHNAF